MSQITWNTIPEHADGSNAKMLDDRCIENMNRWMQELEQGVGELNLLSFLLSISGYDRIPIIGIPQKLTINISEASEKLPVFHSCGMTVDIPVNCTREKLMESLRHCVAKLHGFHFV